VDRVDDVYVIQFRGLLSNLDVNQLVANDIDLVRESEDPGQQTAGEFNNDGEDIFEEAGGTSGISDGLIEVRTRFDGITAVAVNEVQLLELSGFATPDDVFTLAFGDDPENVTGSDPENDDFVLTSGLTVGELQLALESLEGIASGDVKVREVDAISADRAFEIEFVRELSSQNIDELVATPMDPGTATIAEAIQGLDTAINDVQVLTVDAEGGTFTLSLDVPQADGSLLSFVTQPIAFDVSGDDLRRELQNAFAFVQTGANVTQVVSVAGEATDFFRLAFDNEPTARLITLTDGGGGDDEEQQLTIDATEGSFTVSDGEAITDPLDFDVSAGNLETALEGLPTIGGGNVSVSKSGSVYTITFQGALADTNVRELFIDNLQLRPDNSTIKFDTSVSSDLIEAELNRLDGFLARASIEPTQQGNGTDPEIQTLTINSDGGTFTLADDTTVTAQLDHDISAVDLEAAIEGLASITDVGVVRAGNVYTITFNEAGNPNVDPLVVNPTLLTGKTDLVDEYQINVTERRDGNFEIEFLNTPFFEAVPVVEVVQDSTNGLIFSSVKGVREAFKTDFEVTKINNSYVINFQGKTRELDAGPGAGLFGIDGSGLVLGHAEVVTRMDGINYYGIETLDILLGQGTDIVNVQGTSPGSYQYELASIDTTTNGDGGAVSEVQELSIQGAGDFTLSLDGMTTAPVNVDPGNLEGLAQAIEDALDAAGIGATVTASGRTFTVTFDGVTDFDELSIDDSEMVAVAGWTGLPSMAVSETSTNASGSVPEVQRLTLNAVGDFSLTLPGVGTTGVITIDPTDLAAVAGDVESALDALSGIDVDVVRDDDRYTITFAGVTDHDPLEINDLSLQPVHAVTNIDLGPNQTDGPAEPDQPAERVFISSDANLDRSTIFTTDGVTDPFDFLAGNLDDLNGDLNIVFGNGRHGLMVSDEASSEGDQGVVITDNLPDLPDLNRLSDQSQIWITGLALGGISYGTGGTANLYEGVVYWTGAGNDEISIDGTHVQAPADYRTTTMLNTGLGHDQVTVDLDTAEDGFFVLNTMGGADSVEPSGIAGYDDDVVRAADSTLPLIIFGGLGDDDIVAGENEDVVFGDFGRLHYRDGSDDLVSVLGFGGRGNVITDQVIDATWVFSRDLTIGGVDILQGHLDDDVIVGGAGGTAHDNDGGPIAANLDDFIDGDEGDDFIFGDAVKLFRRDIDPTTIPAAAILNPRFPVLRGQVIYSRTELGEGIQGFPTGDGVDDRPAADAAGEALVLRDIDGNVIEHPYRDLDLIDVPAWAEFLIRELYHDDEIEDGGHLAGSFGDDYIAGGADQDVIFGQLGHDTIQGDGSIEDAIDELSPEPVGGERGPSGPIDLTPTLTGVTAPGALELPFFRPSVEAASDGDDYIEGNGGDDVIFGNLGQDDIIGGNSSLFTLDERDERPDGSDTIFGGSGERIDHDHVVTDADLLDVVHARDADTIAADNANIYRLVGTDGADSGGFLRFNYDDAALAGYHPDVPILPRAVELLDYTLGGPDFRPDKFDELDPGFEPDIGGADEVHGESGDDSIYGMVGDDVLFGDSDDDDIVAGWGHDWVSAGTGTDGVIGDDGRIFTGRFVALPGGDKVADPTEPNHFAELLHGVLKVDEVNKEISTPGNIQFAIINPQGELFKSVDLTPFNLTPASESMDDRLFEPDFANDIIFGGLGNDFLHGSSGDDAISGAEALPDFFARPVNPGDLLRFDPNKIEFADYDEDEPRTKLVPFLLNFDASGDPHPVDTVNDHFDEDAIFGDLGNDWLVGGPDNDHMFGGFGADLLDADDNEETNGGLNDMPDGPDFDQQDVAYGGAGRDVLIGNTAGDRLIDWIGEFNSFLVPFAPFGAFTISRGVPPSMFQFLYDLSEADGADPTRAADTSNSEESIARNGEPDGELGLIVQKDGTLWQDQSGAPIDPQPGNIPGGRRDILHGVDFNDLTAAGFTPDSGTWTLSGGRYQVAPEVLGGDAVSVLHVEDYLPGYFEILATINGGKPTAGLKSNSYLVFDYQSPTDFKFAGVNMSTDKVEMGHRDADGWHVDVQRPARLKPDRSYNVLLALNGTTATLVVAGGGFLSHAFAPRVDPDGFPYGLNAGMIGIGANNSVARIDNVIVQKLTPETTFEHEDDFTDGLADLLTGGGTGLWWVAGQRYVGTTLPGQDTARTALDLSVGPNSRLEIEGTFWTQSLGGVFFDSYGDQDYKFAGIVPHSNQVIIGHWTKHGTLEVDTAAQIPVLTGSDFDLRVSLKGTTVSVAVNGYDVLGHVFNAVVVDGAFGLMGGQGMTSFDRVAVRTDDPAFAEAGAGETLLAAAVPADPVGAESALGEAELAPIVDEAIRRWRETGTLDDEQLAALQGVSFELADLSGTMLGVVTGETVILDTTAAGYGWFVDATPPLERRVGPDRSPDRGDA
jgi:Ca2+-binding RTX toxin-like protein